MDGISLRGPAANVSQIAVTPNGDIYALCQDNTIWVSKPNHKQVDAPRDWVKVYPPPP